MLAERLYAVGGDDGAGNHVSSVERYAEEKDEWEAVAGMSTAREHAGACVLGVRLYAVGGVDNADNHLSSVEHYDVRGEGRVGGSGLLFIIKMQ